MAHFHRLLVISLLLWTPVAVGATGWEPVKGHIMTRWAESVTPDNVWKEYPRPQMVRGQWMNLNGLWDYAIEGEPGEWRNGRLENATFNPLNELHRTSPAQWDGKILVPFAVEAPLSGVGKLVRPNQLLWYRRGFDIPPGWDGRSVRLNFEAVDWHAIVWVNGKRVGENKGGYVRFSFDITDALTDSGPQEVILAVWDPTNMGDQTIGKQSLPEFRKGFRYTPTTGIWQTVWLEPAAETYIERVKTVPDIDNQQVLVSVEMRGMPVEAEVEAVVLENGTQVASASGVAGAVVPVRIPKPALWTPENPLLYELKLTLKSGEKTLDQVESYFGMRKIALGIDASGIRRVFLNNELVPFQYGPLDQGYWPDGILTPASDQAAEFDVQYLKDIACNMVRVHVKIHPDRWYYHCDRLGLLVWQDMICTRKFDQKITRESAEQWELEQRRMIDHLHNHPSIINWIVFNEGWGQYDTERLTNWAKQYDPTRLVTGASGWTDYAGVGDIHDVHDYSYFPSIPLHDQDKDRAVLLGEFGGFNVSLPGHIWHKDQETEVTRDPLRERGRESYADGESWWKHYEQWIGAWRYLIGGHGLNAGVYTQISDVEHELNGWLTYDREVSKIPVERLRKLHSKLYQAPPRPKSVLLHNSKDRPLDWRYATETTASDWHSESFDDSGWRNGTGPFAGAGSGTKAGTVLKTRELYLRRALSLDRIPEAAAIRAYTEGSVDVYINGQLARGYNTQARGLRAGASVIPLPPPSMHLLRKGNNTIAIKVESKGDPLCIDFGLIELQ